MRRWSLLLLLLLASCANIIDLEERKVGGSTGTCATYCEQALAECTAANGGELFMTPDTCRGTCLEYPVGDSKDPTGNTLACRMVALASVITSGEPAGSCPSAGPGGGAGVGGAISCGSNCEGYCALYESVCGMAIPDCVNKCPALRDTGSFNVTADYTSGQDTLQCRLAHLGAAAAAKHNTDPAVDATMAKTITMTHCGHSGLNSSAQCNVTDDAMKPISCQDYCRLTAVACTGGNQVYENDAQCEKTCALLPSGLVKDVLLNNVRCRRENGYKALTTANAGEVPLDCSNAGPAPALCGSGKCESYCLIAKAACPAGFKATYNDDLTACQTACAAFPDSTQAVLYSTSDAATAPVNALQCRLRFAVRALGGDAQPTTCMSAFGAPGCK